MCAVPWLAEQLQFVVNDICLWVKHSMFQLDYIDSIYNTSSQIAKVKLHCIPSCAVLCC